MACSSSLPERQHRDPFAEALPTHPRWPEFLDEYWLKRPFLFEGVLSEPFLSEPALLHVYRAARTHAAGDHNVRTYTLPRAGGAARWQTSRGADCVRWLPSDADASMTAYAARLLEHGELAELSAHLRYNMLRFGPDAWWRARSLLTPLFEATGFPAGGWDLDCYAGQYQQTVFGVHTDDEDQLYLTPIGTKVMKLWHPRDWCAAEAPESFRHHSDRHPVPPLTFTVGPTDVLYWPQEYFHIGESPGFALSVQINMRRIPAHAAGGDALPRSGYGPGRPSSLHDRCVAVAAGPSESSPVAGRLQLTGRGEALRYDAALCSSWFSTSEMPPIPFRVPLPVDAISGDAIRVAPEFPILYGAAEGDLVVACNGEVWSVADTAAARRLLDCLEPAAVWSKHALLEAVNAGVPEDEQIDRETLDELLTELAASGVVRAA